eukprot:m.51458 g.51458  ORF g.51458 m.51458 type:complete len:54 (+) comp16437_c0_seq2:109-270(+)
MMGLGVLMQPPNHLCGLSTSHKVTTNDIHTAYICDNSADELPRPQHTQQFSKK